MIRRGWPVLIAALLLSSCGNGDDAADNGDDGETAPPVATTPEGGTAAPGTTDPTDPTGTVAPPTAPPPDCTAPGLIPDQLDEVHLLISSTVLADFFSQRHDDGYIANLCWHDWTTDDCSAPGLGSTGLSYDFTHPCHRHDFGYRNYKRLGSATGDEIWNAENKFATDDQFLEDMREHCSARPWYLKTQCLGWAQAYYYAVRAFG